MLLGSRGRKKKRRGRPRVRSNSAPAVLVVTTVPKKRKQRSDQSMRLAIEAVKRFYEQQLYMMSPDKHYRTESLAKWFMESTRGQNHIYHLWKRKLHGITYFQMQ